MLTSLSGDEERITEDRLGFLFSTFLSGSRHWHWQLIGTESGDLRFWFKALTSTPENSSGSESSKFQMMSVDEELPRLEILLCLKSQLKIGRASCRERV